MTNVPFDPDRHLTPAEIDRLRWPDGNPHTLRAALRQVLQERDQWQQRAVRAEAALVRLGKIQADA